MTTLKLFFNPLTRIALIATISGILGGWLVNHFSDPNVVTRTIHDTQQVLVDRPVLSEKIVTKVLSDPKDKVLISQLMRENASLKLEVVGFNQTIATLKSTGGTDQGGVVTIPPPDQPNTKFVYHDWQLEAIYDRFTFGYTLNQKFEVLSTTGLAKDGTRLSLVNVFQIGPDGGRIQIPAKTVNIVADERVPTWRAGFNLQAGVGYTYKRELGGIIGVQWLRKGLGSAENSTVALFSPGIFATSKMYEPMLLPISVNLGSIPHQPLKDVWLSPFASKTRLGATLTATF